MKHKRFTEKQIISILKEREAGMKVAELGRKHGVSEQTIYRWQSKYGRAGSLRGEAAEVAGRGEPAAKADGGGFESGQADARRRHQDVKKSVTSTAGLRAAGRLQQRHQVSRQRVCRLLQLRRSVARHDPVCSRGDEARPDSSIPAGIVLSPRRTLRRRIKPMSIPACVAQQHVRTNSPARAIQPGTT